MKHLFKLFLFSISFYYSYSFNNNLSNLNNLHSNKKFLINRKNIYPFLYFFTFPKFSFADNNDKSLDELRSEANRIIEIIEAQKNSFSNLPSLSNTPSQSNTPLKSKSTQNYNNYNKNVFDTLDNILYSFKYLNATQSLQNLQDFCSNTNYIKNYSINRLINSFNDSKYAILLGKFSKYNITNFNYYNYFDDELNTNIEGYEVDSIIYADYKTMIYNSIQFDDMYYPIDNNSLHYIIYRWNFVKYNNSYLLESCYLLKK